MFNVKRKVFVVGFLFVFVSLVFSVGAVEEHTNHNSKQEPGITFSVDSRLLVEKRLSKIKINGNDFSGDEIEKALGKSHEIKFNSEVEICFDEMEGYDLYCVIYENEKEAKNFGAIEQKKLCFEFTEEDDSSENSVKAKGDEDIVVKLYYQKIKPIKVTVPKMDNCDVSVKIVRDGKECGIFGENEEIELERGDEIKKTIVYNSGYDAPKEDPKEITVDSKFTEKSFLDFIEKGKPERESQLFFDIPNEFNCTVELNGETSFDCYDNKEPLKVKSGDVVKFYLTKPELKNDERVIFVYYKNGTYYKNSIESAKQCGDKAGYKFFTTFSSSEPELLSDDVISIKCEDPDATVFIRKVLLEHGTKRLDDGTKYTIKTDVSEKFKLEYKIEDGNAEHIAKIFESDGKEEWLRPGIYVYEDGKEKEIGTEKFSSQKGEERKEKFETAVDEIKEKAQGTFEKTKDSVKKIFNKD